ncbi:glutamate racemase [Dechloromonas denitrificans]|uniref:Glutamate racemase n=1 Tax=Dechloromonas denitrificans TaxID=281362 RepID=A0A133XMT0_9RHOO|nr:glutamate racemase [Dechloromonas denitrificans]KXB32248.1 glutamate racemase [Dechloromonas denitrificans]
MPLNNQPIAVFDSGLGGLTVLRALRDRLPQEDFFYFADTRFLPYGDRPETFLKERGVLIAEALARRGAKALVIACNTATAAAAEAIRAASSLPIVALEPGVKPAASLTRSGVIGVLATTRTLQSERFQRLVGNHANHLRVVAQACPGLAETIEEQGPHSAQVLALLDGFVAPLAAAGADVVVLGCTHYPWVAEAIAARMPAGVSLLDTGEPVARQLERLLGVQNLLGGGHGHLRIATSGAPARVIATVDRLWGQKMPVEHWEP